MISKGILPEFSVAPHGEGITNLKINVPENGKCYLKLIYHLKKELPLLDEDHILGFDEIEVSKEDTKCKLAEKWIPKTVVDSELQVNENDTQIQDVYKRQVQRKADWIGFWSVTVGIRGLVLKEVIFIKSMECIIYS